MKRTASLALLLLICALFIPWGAPSAHYASVSLAEREYVAQEELGLQGPAEFVVQEGVLYLRVQTLRTASLLTYVDAPVWTREALREFRGQQPELEPYWPDTSRADGGVRWAAGPEQK